MKRKIILSREAVLWEAGDAARTFAVLESGKLGIRTDQGLQGIVIPGMSSCACAGGSGGAPACAANGIASTTHRNAGQGRPDRRGWTRVVRGSRGWRGRAAWGRRGRARVGRASSLR